MESSPLFFQLPLSVRIEIYRLCGLIRQCPIDLNFENVRQRWIGIDRATTSRSLLPPGRRFPQTWKTGTTTSFSMPEGLNCFCPSIPIQLLLVSRAFHDDVELILYGKNQFKAVCHLDDLADHPLKVLWTFSPRTWKTLTSLHIGLTYITPEYYSRPLHGQPQLEVINSATSEGSQMIRGWTEVCDQLLCKITPSRFKLSLCCKVSNEGSAIQVIEPLKRVQPIAEAAIWLHSDPNEKELTRVAKKAAHELVDPNKDKQASPKLDSRWNDLPREIRLAILSHTSLVVHTPLPDLEPPLERDGFEVLDGKLESRASVCCLNCNPTRSVCNCASKAAASSTTCTCSAVPADLFPVSKLMHAESKEILFSCNRFILSGEFKASKRWLSSLAPTNAGYLRMIDLDISWDQLHDLGKPLSTLAGDWEDLVACLASLLTPGKTWLSIDTSDTWEFIVTINPERPHAYAWLHTAYAKLFEPLYKHFAGREPRKFHVFLSWFLGYESMVEKTLMCSDYNSAAEGKIPWERRHVRFPHSEQKASKQNRTWPRPHN